jgi:hypothetical protein
MKNEELVQALREMAVPDIHCNEYRTWLRTNLLQMVVVQSPLKNILIDNLKSWAGKIIVLLRPQTKMGRVMTYGTLALIVILVTLFAGVLPYVNHKTNVALAENIIRNDPGIAVLFQDDEIYTISVTIQGYIATADIAGARGKTVKVYVDIKGEKVYITAFPPSVPNLADITDTDNGKKIIAFLNTDSQAKEIFNQGAILAGIFQQYHWEISLSSDGKSATVKSVNDNAQAQAMLVTTSTKWTITLDVTDYNDIKIINITSGSVIESVNP